MDLVSKPTGDREIDLEKGHHHVSPPSDVGGSGAHEANVIRGQSEARSGSSQALPSSNNDANPVPQSVIDEVAQGRSEAPITDVNQPKHDDGPGHTSTLTQVGSTEKLDERAREATKKPPPNIGGLGGNSDQDPRMIGDFDVNAHAFWNFFNNKAKIYDGARMKTLKEDLDSPLVFAGLFSTVLTAFLIDNKQTLKVSPQDQMVYYLQQNVAILDQISHQISTIAPQFPIPSTPPPPFPAFKPLASDICVNVFWFMSLIFSLAAALLAILVQKWARDYMHLFGRHTEPVKSARLRQYFIEGIRECHLRGLAEAVPTLLHVSLFLFFVGLCDSILNINTAVGLTSTVLVSITGLLYILVTVAPVKYPKSPYKNALSGLIWGTVQRFGGRQFKDQNCNGASKPVSSDMAKGQTQLAMEETPDRKKRDGGAIEWLVSNTTEDAEMESLIMTIPGSFTTPWGQEVWKTDSSATPLVRSMLETCKNRYFFASDELWRRRTRACIETTASLVCCAGAGPRQFGDILKLLGDIGSDQDVRNPSSIGKERSFVICWTYLSLVIIRPLLEFNPSLQNDARLASQRLGRMDNTSEGQALTRTEKIIETLNKASECLRTLSDALLFGGVLTEKRVRQIFRKQENRSLISKLEQIDNDIKNGGFEMDDWSINSVQNFIDQITHQVITRQLPGVKSDLNEIGPLDLSQFVELFRDPDTLLFISPLRNLRRIHSFAQTLRKILQGQTDVDTFQKAIKNLREFGSLPNWSGSVHRQVWRLQDLSAGGGLGFTVELFFLALKQLLSESSSEESHSAFYIGTFRSITSDWSKYKQNSPGTQELLLDLVVSNHNSISVVKYPADIVTEFLDFLGKMLKGETVPRFEHVETELDRCMNFYRDDDPRKAQCSKALDVIRSARGSST